MFAKPVAPEAFACQKGRENGKEKESTAEAQIKGAKKRRSEASVRTRFSSRSVGR